MDNIPLRKRRILPTYFWFILPATLIYSVFIIYPTFSSFYYGMTDWNGFTRTMNFTGLENFRKLFSDEKVLNAFVNTFKVVIVSVILQNLLGLFFALILDTYIKTKKILRTLIFIPVVISPLVVAFLWSYMYSFDMGAINNFLQAIGLESLRVDWLGNYKIALYSVTWISIWQWFGFQMVIFLAALQGIPPEVIEAARIDGASTFRKTWHVTLPLLAPAFTINIILCTIGSLKTFDTVFATTKGGPGYSTETIAIRMFEQGFTNQKMGYAASIGLVLFAVIALITLVQVKVLRKREVEM